MTMKDLNHKPHPPPHDLLLASMFPVKDVPDQHTRLLGSQPDRIIRQVRIPGSRRLIRMPQQPPNNGEGYARPYQSTGVGMAQVM
jgi:hypothetical protein